MTNFMKVLTIVAAAALVAPLPVSALAIEEPVEEAVDDQEGSCTEQYIQCIAEAGLLEEPFRTMADLECGAEWTACVAKKIIFW
jgi:hypothetical protein